MSLFVTVVVIEYREWKMLGDVALIWVLYFPLVYISTRYRVFWRDDRIRQTASGGPEITLLMDEIGLIALEVDNTPGRPFRRIAIYKRSSTSGDFIDVS